MISPLLTHADAHSYILPFAAVWALRAIWLLWKGDHDGPE